MVGFGGGGGAGRSKEEGLQRGGSWDNKGNTIMLYICVEFYFVDWIIDTFVHVFLSFLAYILNFESNSCTRCQL